MPPAGSTALMETSDESSLTPPVTEILVDVPGWTRVQPRIPDTPQRRTLEAQRSVREIVFGVQDGILTTLGIIPASALQKVRARPSSSAVS